VNNIFLAKQSVVLESEFKKHAPAVSRHAFTFDIAQISSRQELQTLESDWRGLEAENQITPTVFQSYDWVKNWCSAYRDSIASGKLTILTGRQEGKLVFIFPLMITTMHGLKALQWLTEPIGQYGDVLCAKGQDTQNWMGQSIAFLRAAKKFDLLRLRHVRADSLAAPYVQTQMHDAKFYERAPYLDLTQFKSDEEYDARYTSNQRKRRKKIRKNLEDLGAVSFKKLKPAESKLAIDISIEEKNAWLAERGRYNRVMGCPHHIGFLKSMTDAKSANFEMVTTELSTAGKPMSWEIAFQYRGTHFAYITSHMNQHTDLSPGRLHMDLSQRAAIAAGLKRFDLMVPYDQHKESWSSAMVDTNDYYIGLSSLGSAYGNIYLRNLRPLVRKLYYKTPPWALRLLQTICCNK
jgi:CelD/BcsL family acetyltransferase involved in cellulose biosynthesis